MSIPERRLIAADDQEIALSMLEEARLALVEIVGLPRLADEDSAREGVVGTLRDEWTHLTPARKADILSALRLRRVADDPMLVKLRAVDSITSLLLENLAQSVALDTDLNAAWWDQLSWCAAILRLE